MLVLCLALSFRGFRVVSARAFRHCFRRSTARRAGPLSHARWTVDQPRANQSDLGQSAAFVPIGGHLDRLKPVAILKDSGRMPDLFGRGQARPPLRATARTVNGWGVSPLMRSPRWIAAWRSPSSARLVDPAGVGLEQVAASPPLLVLTATRLARLQAVYDPRHEPVGLLARRRCSQVTR